MFDENVNEGLRASDENRDGTNKLPVQEVGSTIEQENKVQEASEGSEEVSGTKAVQNIESQNSKKAPYNSSKSSSLGLGIVLGAVSGIFLTAIIFTIFFGSRLLTTVESDYRGKTSQNSGNS